jgi:hypothetical protein
MKRNGVPQYVVEPQYMEGYAEGGKFLQIIF